MMQDILTFLTPISNAFFIVGIVGAVYYGLYIWRELFTDRNDHQQETK